MQHTLVIETTELTKEFDDRIADEPVSGLDRCDRPPPVPKKFELVLPGLRNRQQS